MLSTSGAEITHDFGHVAEQRDFALQIAAQLPVAAANQNVRLNSDAEHFLHAVLRRLGLQFAGRGDERHQREVHEEHIFRAQLQAHLADRFQERQRFDVAHRAADFDDHHVHAVRHLAERGFDFIGDVRNHLHGLAEIIAAAFFGDDGFVDSAGGPVVVARQMRVGEALVVAQVEIGFRAVVGDKHFAVLIGRHRAGINVQVGIALLEGDFETAAFEQAADRGRRDAFAQGRNYAAGYKDVLRGGPQGARIPPLESAYYALWSETRRVSNRVREIIFSLREIDCAASGSSALPAEFFPRAGCPQAHPR